MFENRVLRKMFGPVSKKAQEATWKTQTLHERIILKLVFRNKMGGRGFNQSGSE